MRELREDTFFGNKNEDSHDHIDRVFSIVGLFNIPGVSKDAIMLRVFPSTLTGSAKRWVDRLAPGTINTWDLLKKSFIQRYCPPSMTAKQLEDIHNFKQEGDGSLYQACEWYNDLLYKCPTHDINNHQKGPIPRMTPAQALTAIQTMADHSQKWHDGTTSRNIGSSSSNDALAALVNKNNGGKFHVGPHGYYTKIENRPPYGEKRQGLEELLAKHQEESAQRSTKIEEIHSDKTLSSSSEQIKTVTTDHETSWLNKLHGVSFTSGPKSDTLEVLQHQLPPKELNPGSFTLPCTIGRPFLATIHAEIDVFTGKISLGINEDRISFDTTRKDHNYTNLSEKHFMVRPQSPAQSNNQIDYEESEIDKLADEYELGIGKKGHILDNIWEYCNQVHNKNYGWHNYKFKNEECEEIGIKDKDYHPPEVQVETFEVKKYSFEGEQSFICVTKDLDNILPLGRKNGSKFKEMIRKEVDKT
ncbi:hypothetical protein Tco_1218103 [Tanacetum coccineum]